MIRGKVRLTFILAATGFGLINALACGPSASESSTMPGHLEVESQSEASATQNSDLLVMSYVLVNRGPHVIHLGPITTSCGCSSAQAKPEEVPSGGKTVVRAEARPPDVGTNPIQIKVATDDLACPSLVLHWKLTSHPTAPHLIGAPPTINLGILRPGSKPDPQVLQLSVLEEKDTTPLITAVISDQPTDPVVGGMTDELATEDARLVTRTYRYEIRVEAIPPIGNILRQLTIKSRIAGANPWLIVPIRGTVLPPIRAIPTEIALVASGVNSVPSARVMILSNDPASDLKAECINHDARVTVRRSFISPDRIVFEVEQLSSTDESPLRSLQFRVDQPSASMLEVPIMQLRQN